MFNYGYICMHAFRIYAYMYVSMHRCMYVCIDVCMHA